MIGGNGAPIDSLSIRDQKCSNIYISIRIKPYHFVLIGNYCMIIIIVMSINEIKRQVKRSGAGNNAVFHFFEF